MKKILLFTAGLLLGLSIGAASVKQKLTINGEVVEKTVSKITFDGDNVVLLFSDQTRQEADLESVVLSFLPDTPTSIYSLHQTVGDKLDIKGLEDGTQVIVFDASGKKILTSNAENTSALLTTRTLKSGIYIIKAGNKVIKFLKR